MPIRKRTWIGFTLLALLGLGTWYLLSISRFSFIDIPVTRAQANKIAGDYLSKIRHIDPARWKRATVFITVDDANHYLQRALGFKGQNDFIRQHHFDLFLWVVRFFHENEQEEYRLSISASSGKITAFKHIIEATAHRQDIPADQAEQMAIDFLTEQFHPDLSEFALQGRLQSNLENRVEFSFAWKKEDSYVPWDDDPDAGKAKLVTGITLSGDEILSFSKYRLDIPEKFYLDKARKQQISHVLSTVTYATYLILLTAAVFFVILRRNHLPMHVVKRFIIGIAVFYFAWSTLDELNVYENIIFNYPTTTPTLQSYLTLYIIRLIISSFLAGLAILMPALAGESLAHEQLPLKEGGLRHYITSTFFSRPAAQMIAIGYLTAAVMLGLQTILFFVGQKNLGVWIEHRFLTQISNSYWPFLEAFILGFKASIFEEMTFRVFAISWLKKLTRSTIFAVILASLLWGLGHSHYEIFPMWFRVIEVSILGVFLSCVYLKFGIIPVVVAHFVFDVFWMTTPYLLGRSTPFDLYSGLMILLLPFFWMLAAWTINRPDVENPMSWRLNKHQLFNLQVLNLFLQTSDEYRSKSPGDVKNELISHGWDIGVVEAALSKAPQKNRQI